MVDTSCKQWMRRGRATIRVVEPKMNSSNFQCENFISFPQCNGFHTFSPIIKKTESLQSLWTLLHSVFFLLSCLLFLSKKSSTIHKNQTRRVYCMWQLTSHFFLTLSGFCKSSFPRCLNCLFFSQTQPIRFFHTSYLCFSTSAILFTIHLSTESHQVHVMIWQHLTHLLENIWFAWFVNFDFNSVQFHIAIQHSWIQVNSHVWRGFSFFYSPHSSNRKIL